MENAKSILDVVNSVNNKKDIKLTADWQDLLDRSSKGLIKATNKNHVLIWENHEKFKGWTLRFNDFLRRIEINGEPINDTWRAKLRNMYEEIADFRNKNVTDDFIDEYSMRNKYNPVIDYLMSIKNKRNEDIKCKDVFLKWFNVDYKDDVEKNIIERLSEKWFVSAIKRIFEPGCFIEGMIVLIGKTGIGKSTFLNRLGKGYTIEASFDIENENKSVEALNRAWICNFDEFKSLSKKDPDVVKEYLTKTSGVTRLAYRHDAEEYPRHNIFISGTNNGFILKDFTGLQERRFWPLRCKLEDKTNIYNNFTDDIVDAIWADALNIYLENKDYNISISDFDDNETNTFIKMQRLFKTYMNDDYIDTVNELLNKKYKLNINGEFESLEDFKKQIAEPYKYAKDDIKRIPISWINIVMQTLYHRSRKNDLIAAALADDWYYKKAVTTGGNCMTFIRKDSLNIFD